MEVGNPKSSAQYPQWPSSGVPEQIRDAWVKALHGLEELVHSPGLPKMLVPARTHGARRSKEDSALDPHFLEAQHGRGSFAVSTMWAIKPAGNRQVAESI